MKVSVIIPAAGESSRFGGQVKKPFVNLDGRAVFLRTLELFVNRDDVCQMILAVSSDDMEMVKRKFGANLGFMAVSIVEGGKYRWQTVKNALSKVRDDAEYVAIHDAVRPCLTQERITEVFSAAEKTGAAILAAPINETIKRVKDKMVKETVDRESLFFAQTPQVFKRDVIIDAYNKLTEDLADNVTDDAKVVELAGNSKIVIVESDATNIKITTQQDLKLAQSILKILPKPKAKGPEGPWAAEKGW